MLYLALIFIFALGMDGKEVVSSDGNVDNVASLTDVQIRRAIGTWNRQVVMAGLRAAQAKGLDITGHDVDVAKVLELVKGGRAKIAALIGDFEHPDFPSAAKADMFLEWLQQQDVFGLSGASVVSGASVMSGLSEVSGASVASVPTASDSVATASQVA